jgi:hypothetical protein
MQRREEEGVENIHVYLNKKQPPKKNIETIGCALSKQAVCKKGEDKGSLHEHVNITQYLFVVINGKATMCDVPSICFFVCSTSVLHR